MVQTAYALLATIFRAAHASLVILAVQSVMLPLVPRALSAIRLQASLSALVLRPVAALPDFTYRLVELAVPPAALPFQCV